MLYASNTFVPYNSPLKEAQVAFMGVPFSSTATSAPSNYGPTMVRESLKLVESRLGKLRICDLGDLEVVPGSFELTAERLRDTIREAREQNPKLFFAFIGGDHSMSFPISDELKAKTIIHLDAHSDSRREYLGNMFMHQTWAYHASKYARVIQIGLNSVSEPEHDEIRSNPNIDPMTVSEFLEEFEPLKEPVHLSIDIDVFDPSYVVTGLPEGKLRPEQVFAVLEKAGPACSSMDIMEIADTALPSKTGFLAAHIIKFVLEKKFLE
jgi:agmatinase